MNNGVRIFGGTGNPALELAICNELGVQPGQMKLNHFADGEIYPQLLENVRGYDVFVVQPTCAPVNDMLMELVLIADALHRASAESITAVMPYFGYARQDRKDKPRVPISAKVVANMLQAAHVDRILSVDLHSAPIQGFFEIPVDHLYALPVFIEHFNQNPIENLTVVSPDAGGVARAREMAKRLNAPLAIIDKRRIEANVAEVMNVIGDVKDRNCLMVDDMIDTAGTLVKGASALMLNGARSVRAAATHGVLSPKDGTTAEEKIDRSPIIEVLIANTIPRKACCNRNPDCPYCHGKNRIRQLSVAPLMAQAIKSIHEKTSVSSLFI